jgi:hypothetical protein
MDAREYDTEKLDEIVLVLLRLNAFTENGVTEAWAVDSTQGRLSCRASGLS